MTRYWWLPVAAGYLFLTYATSAETTSEMIKRAKPAVVEIVALDRKGSPTKFGTGFFISSDGQLITNRHVIDGTSSLVVFDSLGARLTFERMLLREEFPDLALLKFQVKGVPFLKLREADDIAEGEKVIVIGNPNGLIGTVSDGIVSGFRENGLGIPLIQITAPISAGSSGSPVLDENGEVVGVATLTNTQGQNLNFAIAGRKVRELVREEWCDEHPDACNMLGYLGSTIRDMTAAQKDKARSIIEKFVAEVLAAKNDPSLDAAAKKTKMGQVLQEYYANMRQILTPAQYETFVAAEESQKKRAAGEK